MAKLYTQIFYYSELYPYICKYKLIIMHIISHKKITEYYTDGHADAEVPLERWYAVAAGADWKNMNDIKKDFPSVDYVGNQHYVFNIHGNGYRLVVVVKFTPGLIFIRWVGTHAEYDKIDCSTI